MRILLRDRRGFSGGTKSQIESYTLMEESQIPYGYSSRSNNDLRSRMDVYVHPLCFNKTQTHSEVLRMNDPVMNNLVRFNGMNVNHASIPVVRKILTSTLSEFDPVYWSELQTQPVYVQVIAKGIYARIRERIEKGL